MTSLAFLIFLYNLSLLKGPTIVSDILYLNKVLLLNLLYSICQKCIKKLQQIWFALKHQNVINLVRNLKFSHTNEIQKYETFTK